MPKPAPGEAPLYKGTVDCVLKTVRGEGVRGLYKGKMARKIPLSSAAFL